jgi:hypothetical protein
MNVESVEAANEVAAQNALIQQKNDGERRGVAFDYPVLHLDCAARNNLATQVASARAVRRLAIRLDEDVNFKDPSRTGPEVRCSEEATTPCRTKNDYREDLRQYL